MWIDNLLCLRFLASHIFLTASRVKAPNTIIPKTHCNDSIFYLIIFFSFYGKKQKRGNQCNGKVTNGRKCCLFTLCNY